MKINFWYCISVLKVLLINIQSFAVPENMCNFSHTQFVALEYCKRKGGKLADYAFSEGVVQTSSEKSKLYLTLLWIHTAEGSAHKLLVSRVLECDAGISSLQSYL